MLSRQDVRRGCPRDSDLRATAAACQSG